MGKIGVAHVRVGPVAHDINSNVVAACLATAVEAVRRSTAFSTGDVADRLCSAGSH